jgi:hypothetical protein
MSGEESNFSHLCRSYGRDRGSPPDYEATCSGGALDLGLVVIIIIIYF